MIGEPVFPPVLRIRVTQGEHAGLWLDNLGVSQGGVRVMTINMGMILKQPARYTFHPTFTANERAACKLCWRSQMVISRFSKPWELLPKSWLGNLPTTK